MTWMTFRVRVTALALLAVTAALTPWPSAAQLAPTGGHYAARPSDTGYPSNGPNALGAFSTSVPLTLPPARGGLPVPLQLAFGGPGFGAAGIGWDVPFAYVQVQRSFVHRRPARQTGDMPPTPREQITVVLPGGRMDMVQMGAEWVARHGATDITLRKAGNNWRVFDGEGLTYTFFQNPRLSGTGLWLLDSISGSGGAKLVLLYDIQNPVLTGASSPALSIDLVRIQYNPHPTAGCFKHDIALDYDAPSTEPLALTVVEGRVLARVHKLVRLDVLSRATCDTAPERLRSYVLSYKPDPDTGRSRLATVQMTGRQGTPEATTPLPVVSYEYGTATHESGGERVLRYQKTQSIPVPAGPLVDEIAGTIRDASVHAPISGSSVGLATWQSLTDVTGDGRPDLIYRRNDQLWMARNLPGLSGTTTLGIVDSKLSDMVFKQGPFEKRTGSSKRFTGSGGETHIDYVWRQAIDVNGDGRVDVIDASEEKKHWVVYLNTPDPGPSGVRWVRRSLFIGSLYQRFVDLHLAVESDYLPLSRRFTGHNTTEKRCWKYENGGWTSFDELELCFATSASDFVGPEETYTEWEVLDVNGDGYPDVVFNSSPVKLVSDGPPPLPPPGDQHVHFQAGSEKYHVRPADAANAIEVAFNVGGLRMTDDVHGPAYNPFSAPVAVRDQASCGVAHWVQMEGPQLAEQAAACGLMDVNGDGLVDLVEDRAVFLGTGSGFDSAAPFTIPGPLAQQLSGQPPVCGSITPATQFFDTTHTAGLRDLTGDGIPDYVQRQGTGFQVFIGNGTGFQAPVPITGDFALSEERENCDGSISRTRRGLYDLDGDGKPETVALNDTNLDVFQLASGETPRTPEAGQLVRVDNGYGAVTTIEHVSAKEDGGTLHQVPFPEIVVSSVQTTGTQGLGGSLSATRYAYGGAEMFYDSTVDRFVVPGYRRSVTLRSLPAAAKSRAPAVATVVDAYPLALWTAAANQNERFGRYLRLGKVRDVTILGGDLPTTPWELLPINVATDSRRLAAIHYDWQTRTFDQPAGPSENELCLDLVQPYDFDLSLTALGSNAFDPCSAHGFISPLAVTSWRGTEAPPSTSNVEVGSSVRSVDAYGRVLSVLYANDLHRGDDDLCVDIEFAASIGPDERVLSAPASRKVWECTRGPGGTVLSLERWEYDGLAQGSVGAGRITGHTLQRRASDSGELFGTVRDFDATYDPAGNPFTLTSKRDDGVVRTQTLRFDPFGLVPIRTETTGTGVPALGVTFFVDPVSLDVVSAKDANSSVQGTMFDGFGRPVLATVEAPQGPSGAIVSLMYSGFSGGDPLGRRVIVKEVTDPVAPASFAEGTGRTSTFHFDELGRSRFTEFALGADYANETLFSDATTYDPLGRVVFEADPFLASQDPVTAYGTTTHFNVDGSVSAFIRGRGPQRYTDVLDAATERYPTLVTHAFADNTEWLSVQDAASLVPGTPLSGVVHRTVTTAAGRPLERSTWKNGARLDYATFAHDRQGQLTGMTRYQDSLGGTRPVAWTWRFDSLGQLVQVQEPDSPPQIRSYSSWGELTQVQWALLSPQTTRAVVRKYDAFSRLTHSEEQTDGVTDPATANDYDYDFGTPVSAQGAPTFLMGRMARAAAPTGQEYFSYDNFGRVNARTFTDESNTPYVEKDQIHADGSPASVELNLPDNGYRPERVEYRYDSAARPRAMEFSDGLSTQSLYSATALDPFGRTRSAVFGKTTYTASYADEGRRLLEEVSLSSPLGSRSIRYDAYDPLGRSLSRTEKTATGDLVTSVAYDPLGRLFSSTRTAGTQALQNWHFSYDPLGNVHALTDSIGPASAELSYQQVDRDRICRVGYGAGGLDGTACNVLYDGLGNIEYLPTRTGARDLTYFNSGLVRALRDEPDGAEAQLRYDAFGQLQTIDIVNGEEKRSDRHLGALITQRYHRDGPLKASYLSRSFPAPGASISRRGPTGPWIFQFGEARGARFATDAQGAFVQDITYQPFGEATSTGAQPGTVEHSPEQWNDGDEFAPFGVVQLGARPYDPVIGRFLSRDPLLIPRTASTSNPYAFAMNDPWNLSDPTGTDPEDSAAPPIALPGYGGGDAGGPSGGGSSSHPPHRRTTSHMEGEEVFNGVGGWWSAPEQEEDSDYDPYSVTATIGEMVISGIMPSIKGQYERRPDTLLEMQNACNRGLPTLCMDERDRRIAGRVGEAYSYINWWMNQALTVTGSLQEALAAIGPIKSGLSRLPAAEAAIVGEGGVAGRQVLYHYTSEAGAAGIAESNSLRPSLWRTGTKDVRYGNGQYVSDIVPGTRTPAELSRDFLGQPFQGKRFTHYVEIDATGLGAVEKRSGVYVIRNDVPLDLTGRLLSSGKVPRK